VIALGIALLGLGLACGLVSLVALVRDGPRPPDDDEAWELSRNRAFFISYPAGLLIGAGVIILYLFGRL
jgi:hypothetical protein